MSQFLCVAVVDLIFVKHHHNVPSRTVNDVHRSTFISTLSDYHRYNCIQCYTSHLLEQKSKYAP